MIQASDDCPTQDQSGARPRTPAACSRPTIDPSISPASPCETSAFGSSLASNQSRRAIVGGGTIGRDYRRSRSGHRPSPSPRPPVAATARREPGPARGRRASNSTTKFPSARVARLRLCALPVRSCHRIQQKGCAGCGSIDQAHRCTALGLLIAAAGCKSRVDRSVAVAAPDAAPAALPRARIHVVAWRPTLRRQRHRVSPASPAEDAALPLLDAACARGDADSCANLGGLLTSTMDRALHDERRALAAYARGCELGNNWACCGGGKVHENGSVMGPPVAKDFAAAARLYRVGCDHGEMICCVGLGTSTPSAVPAWRRTRDPLPSTTEKRTS